MSQPMSQQHILQTVLPVIEVFDRLGIPYHVGGSVASSFYGVFRMTHDIDLIADIQIQHVLPLVAVFDPNDYLVIDQAIIDAIIHQSSFNIIDLRLMNKIDVFIQQQTPFAIQEQQRIQQNVITIGTPPIWMASVEDMILQKILWWQSGGSTSNQQWTDIIDMIQQRAAVLDQSYLKNTAALLNVSLFLLQAFADAGVPFP